MPPTAKRKLTPGKKIAARAETPPAAPADDMDQFRNLLARRFAMLISDQEGCWRSCKEPACRRKRACAAPRMRCSNEPPAPPATPDQVARTKAAIQRALQERLAQIEAEE